MNNLTDFMMTWTCHVCGDERPDKFISVYKLPLDVGDPRVKATQNIRYCNDRSECVTRRHHVPFFTTGKRDIERASDD